MAQMKAGQTVIEALRAEGVEYTFGVVGTTTNSIVTEMYGRSDIRFVDTRHEEGAAFMAWLCPCLGEADRVYYDFRARDDQPPDGYCVGLQGASAGHRHRRGCSP